MNPKEQESEHKEDKYFISRDYLTHFFSLPVVNIHTTEWLRNMLQSFRELNDKEKDDIINLIDNVIKNLRQRGDEYNYDISAD